MRIIYESFDKKHFENEKECIEYEKKFFGQDINEFLKTIERVKKYCDNSSGCRECIFYKDEECGFLRFSNYVPMDW